MKKIIFFVLTLLYIITIFSCKSDEAGDPQKDIVVLARRWQTSSGASFLSAFIIDRTSGSQKIISPADSPAGDIIVKIDDVPLRWSTEWDSWLETVTSVTASGGTCTLKITGTIQCSSGKNHTFDLEKTITVPELDTDGLYYQGSPATDGVTNWSKAQRYHNVELQNYGAGSTHVRYIITTLVAGNSNTLQIKWESGLQYKGDFTFDTTLRDSDGNGWDYTTFSPDTVRIFYFGENAQPIDGYCAAGQLPSNHPGYFTFRVQDYPADAGSFFIVNAPMPRIIDLNLVS